MNILIYKMKKLLASNFTLFLKTQSFHWNVETMFFQQFHDMFGKMYQDLYEQNDLIAEKIRYMNSYSPGTMNEYLKLTEIKEINEIPTLKNMLTILIDDNHKMILLLNDVFEEANNVNNQAIMDYIAARLDQHQKNIWMLKSSLGK